MGCESDCDVQGECGLAHGESGLAHGESGWLLGGRSHYRLEVEWRLAKEVEASLRVEGSSRHKQTHCLVVQRHRSESEQTLEVLGDQVVQR